jgi:glutamate N-acetyltransferase/amino-acid N-acetyltransferase
VAGGTAAGIKLTGAPDLALVASHPPSPFAAAAVFTCNQAAAAPVQVSRHHLASSGGRIGAVILNSGCANAATGPNGLEVARLMATLTGTALGLAPEHVAVCSTGVIGSELPAAAVRASIPELVAILSADPASAEAAAVAIMTTDTRTKQTVARGDGFVVGAMGKGAAMLAPNMATMLAVLTTDAVATPSELDLALRQAVEGSFNAMSIDGCTSTNDTVILLASGLGARPSDGELAVAVSQACVDLAYQMVSDAEGGTKVVRVVVSGATDSASARQAARAIADSNLVKCSWYGADPNWGRVVSEAGACGAPFDLDRVSVAYGDITVCTGGSEAPHDGAAVRRYLEGRELEVHCDLGLGDARAEILSADLTHAYIDENMGLS